MDPFRPSETEFLSKRSHFLAHIGLDKAQFSVIILYAAINGFLDDTAVNQLASFEADLHRFIDANHPEIGAAIVREKDISAETEEALKTAITEFKQGRGPIS